MPNQSPLDISWASCHYSITALILSSIEKIEALVNKLN
jgi:hypothetical protein